MFLRTATPILPANPDAGSSVSAVADLVIPVVLLVVLYLLLKRG